LFFDDLAKISEDLVQLVNAAFDLSDVGFSLCNERFLEG